MHSKKRGDSGDDVWILKFSKGGKESSSNWKVGQKVELEHFDTKYRLHSHKDLLIKTPNNKQQEVTCYNVKGDPNDIFLVEKKVY